MEPTISKSGTTGAGQQAEDQSLSPQTNVNQATNRANTTRGSTQDAASFSGPADQITQQQQAGYPKSNSS